MSVVNLNLRIFVVSKISLLLIFINFATLYNVQSIRASEFPSNEKCAFSTYLGGAFHDTSVPTKNPSPLSANIPVTVDEGTLYHISSENKNVVRIEALKQEPENKKDKIVVSPILHKKECAIKINGGLKTYIAFDFKINDEYEEPTNWMIHLQAFQCCGGHPPLAIEVQPNRHRADAVVGEIRIRDDINAKTQGLSILSFDIQKRKWYAFELQLSPGNLPADTSDTLSFWINGELVLRSNKIWGFSKDGNETEVGIDVGIYRRRQATTQSISLSRFVRSTKPIGLRQLSSQ